MYHIVFQYRDMYTNGAWHVQEGIFRDLQQCKEFYGLGIDCEYRIVSCEKIK